MCGALACAAAAYAEPCAEPHAGGVQSSGRWQARQLRTWQTGEQLQRRRKEQQAERYQRRGQPSTLFTRPAPQRPFASPTAHTRRDAQVKESPFHLYSQARITHLKHVHAPAHTNSIGRPHPLQVKESPFYLYSQARIAANYKAYQAALSGIDSIIGYAVKANNNFKIVQLLQVRFETAAVGDRGQTSWSTGRQARSVSVSDN